jgi:hypothetical protein
MIEFFFYIQKRIEKACILNFFTEKNYLTRGEAQVK